MAQFGFVAKRIFHIGSWWQKFVVGMATNHLYNQISDDNLRRKLESKSHFGCKRPLKLDTWYPIFTNNNVDLVTDPVTGLTEDGILSREAEGGREIERKMDVLIWDTGYNSNKFGTPVPTRGRTGPPHPRGPVKQRSLFHPKVIYLLLNSTSALGFGIQIIAFMIFSGRFPPFNRNSHFVNNSINTILISFAAKKRPGQA
ncbi:hypothetical protein MFRU_030g00500 [Monilinia fructicola]|nr:hypothetical protein MFRU_030g00500 [Monilinia fructicola]